MRGKMLTTVANIYFHPISNGSDPAIGLIISGKVVLMTTVF